MTDPIRALCAELCAELDHNRRCLLDDATLTHPLADRARAALARWGRPAQPAPPAEGEVTELVAWLRETGQLLSRRPDIQCRVELRLFTRTAELLERLSPVPVPVSDRPWEREGWCDMDGECWWCPPDGPAYWSMVNAAMVYGGWLLPHWAIHQPPQGGEVQP